MKVLRSVFILLIGVMFLGGAAYAAAEPQSSATNSDVETVCSLSGAEVGVNGAEGALSDGAAVTNRLCDVSEPEDKVAACTDGGNIRRCLEKFSMWAVCIRYNCV